MTRRSLLVLVALLLSCAEVPGFDWKNWEVREVPRADTREACEYSMGFSCNKRRTESG